MTVYDAGPERGRNVTRLPAWLAWQPVVAGALLAGLLGGIFVWLAVLPRRDAYEQVVRALADIRAENAKNKDVVENFERFMADFAHVEARYDAYTARVPLEAEKERVSGDLERTTSGVHAPGRGVRASVTRFEAGTPSPLQRDLPGLASLSSVPVTVGIRGNYAGLKRLLGELTRADRLISVRTFEMIARADRAEEDEDTIDATVELVTFFKRTSAPAVPVGFDGAPSVRGAE